MKNKLILFTALILLTTGIILNCIFGNLFSAGTFSYNYFASGDYAVGVFAAGKFATGIFSIGIFSMGIFSVGIFNLGIYAVGIFIFARHKRLPESLYSILVRKPIGAVKAIIVLSIVFAGHSKKVAAQIPNNGFEQWSDKGAYMEPVGFVTPNSLTTGTRYPISRSTDHYPTSVGNYSIKLESNPTEKLFGIALQNNQNSMFAGSLPAFPIKGHPTGLTGYYKYLPQNGDTMIILIQLFKNGSTVSAGTFMSTDTVSDWKSFNISFQNYSTADSASIILSSYMAFGPPPTYVPKGNSVLFVDNLNFDNLITSAPKSSVNNGSLIVYPHPVSDIFKLKIDHMSANTMDICIFNHTGLLVQSEIDFQNNGSIRISDLSNGVYLVAVKTKEFALLKTLIIKR